MKKTTQPLSKITTYGYDNNSNVLTTTDPKNQTMTYTYDELDRVDTGIYRNELNAEKLFHDYKYDAEDNLYEVAERVDFTNNRTYTRTFDKRNRLKSSTDAYSKTVAFTYDAANNLKSLTDAGSKVTSYSYDQQNRLDTVAQNSSTIADYDWYSDGLLKQVKYSETSKRDYNYDNADRVSNITNTIGTGSESFDYGYDANSNRETETRNIDGAVSKTIAYNYDQLNRLESASYTANSATNQLSYTYDAVGNRKTESGTDQNGVAISKTADYDDLDRLTQLTDGSLVSDFEYDDNSNLTKVKLNGTDNETFEYDIRNQLSKYTSIGNGITADYDYDFERKRLSKTVSNVRRDYVYAGNQVINEYVKDTIADTNPVLNPSYGIGSGEIVKSDFVGEGSRNCFSDALGSITSLADTSSSLISRNDYDSFGEIVASSGISQNAVTYTGQRLDVESGLMALGNGERYYNPSYGRFIQQDRFAGLPQMPQSLNRFSYTHNNPNKYTDPTGNYIESAWDAISLGVGLASFAYNIKEGNYGAAALDALGVVVDGVALAIPILPGGAGIAIRASRGVNYAVRSLQTADRAINTYQAASAAGEEIGKGNYGTGALYAGLSVVGGRSAVDSVRGLGRVDSGSGTPQYFRDGYDDLSTDWQKIKGFGSNVADVGKAFVGGAKKIRPNAYSGLPVDPLIEGAKEVGKKFKKRKSIVDDETDLDYLKAREEAEALSKNLQDYLKNTVKRVDSKGNDIYYSRDVVMVATPMRKNGKWEVVVSSSTSKNAIPKGALEIVGKRKIAQPSRITKLDKRYKGYKKDGTPRETHNHAEQKALRWADEQPEVDIIGKPMPTIPYCKPGGCTDAIRDRRVKE